MRTTGVRVAPQPAPRNAPGHPLPLPRTKFPLEYITETRQKPHPSPTLTVLTQAFPPHDHHPSSEKAHQGEALVGEPRPPPSTPSPSPAQYRPSPPIPVPSPSTPGSRPTPSTPGSRPSSCTPPPKPPRTYLHTSLREGQQNSPRNSEGAEVTWIPAGARPTPLLPRPGLMTVLSPHLQRTTRPPPSLQMGGEEAHRPSHTSRQYSQPSQPTSLPPSFSSQPASLPPALPSRPTSTQMIASRTRHRGQGGGGPPAPPAARHALLAPPSGSQGQQTLVCSPQDFEDTCKEVFKHRKVAIRYATAGKYVQAARHYQTALADMDRVLGTQVLNLTTHESMRQKLFTLQQEVFTLRKEVLHGFTDAQTAVETPRSLAALATPTPGAPPSYDDVLKEDRQRQQDESPPLPPRQPTMQGPASIFTRPSRPYTLPKVNSGRSQVNASGPCPQADSSRPQADSSQPQADSSRPQADSSRPQADSSRPQADASRPQADASRPRPQADASRPRPQADASHPQPRPQADASCPRPPADASRPRPPADASRPQPRPQADASCPRPQADASRPQADASRPRPQADASHPQPRPQADASCPRPQADASRPRPPADASRPQPRPQADASCPRPQADASRPRPPADASRPQPRPQADASCPRPQADASRPRPPADASRPQPRPQADASRPRPPADASRPQPRPPADASRPRPQADASRPRPQADASRPRPQADASRPRPQADATRPWPQADASHPQPQVDASHPRPQVDASCPQVFSHPQPRPQVNVSRPKPRPQVNVSRPQPRPRPQVDVSRPQPQPNSLQARPSSLSGAESKVETLVDVSEPARVPSTPGTAPPDLALHPLHPTPVPIRPKSYHPGQKLTPLTPSPSSLSTHLSTLNPSPLTTEPSSLATQSSSHTLPSSSQSEHLSLPTPPPRPHHEPALTPATPQAADEVVQSQMDALHLYQTKGGIKQPPNSLSLQSLPSPTNTPLPLPKQPPPSPPRSQKRPFEFGVVSRTSSNTSGYSSITSGYSSICSPVTPKSVIVDPFTSMDPFPPVDPTQMDSEAPLFNDSPPSSVSLVSNGVSRITSQSKGHTDDQTVTSGYTGFNGKAAAVIQTDKINKTMKVTDRSKQKDSSSGSHNTDDHGDSILEALDFAVVQSHPRLTPRKSVGSAHTRCYSQETLLDHSFGTLDAVLNRDRKINSSRASIIEEFDPLASALLNLEKPREDMTKAAAPEDKLEDEAAATHSKPEEEAAATQSKPEEEAPVRDPPKVRLRTTYPRSDLKFSRNVNVPEEVEYPMVFSEEGAIAGEEEETWDELGVGGTYDDLYYDSDDDLTGQDLQRCEERSSLSSGRTQVMWPPDVPVSQPLTAPQEPASPEEGVDVGRSAFYTSASHPRPSSRDSFRHLLRIREGVKIFFIHKDGVITSPFNKPSLSVTKDSSRDWLIGEGLLMSVGTDLWSCELYSKATLVLKTIQGVYIFKETAGKPDCRAVAVRVPAEVRKAQHELLQNILRENTLLEDERPTGFTKAISKGASSAATRMTKLVDDRSPPTSMAFVRRSSMRALKGVSKRLTTLAERTGSTMKELPEEYKELQEVADILRLSRTAKTVQYI